MAPNVLSSALTTLLTSLHQAGTLWSIADRREPWGRPFAQMQRYEDGSTNALLIGKQAQGTPTAHEQLSTQTRKADAVSMFEAFLVCMDSLPCFAGRPVEIILAQPTKTSRAPAYAMRMEGVLLGNSETPVTAATLVRKLTMAADHLSVFGWSAHDPLWTTTGGSGPSSILLRAPNLETAEIKLALLWYAGKPLEDALSATTHSMAQVHESNLVRRDILRAALRNR